jgi:hypothetical protein
MMMVRTVAGRPWKIPVDSKRGVLLLLFMLVAGSASSRVGTSMADGEDAGRSEPSIQRTSGNGPISDVTFAHTSAAT